MFGKDGPRAVQHLAADVVEYEVDIACRGFELLFVVGDDMVSAQAADIVRVTIQGGGKNYCSGLMCVLHREPPKDRQPRLG